MRYCLASFHGTLLCLRPGAGLYQRPWSGETPADLIWLTLPPEFASVSYVQTITGAPPATAAVTFPGLGPVVVRTCTPRNVISIERNGQYVCAEPSGTVACNRPAADDWEKFALVAEDDLAALRWLREESWILRSTGQIIPGHEITFAPGDRSALTRYRSTVPGAQITLPAGPSLSIGGRILPLAQNLPLARHHAPFRFPIHPDGWKLDELILYRPLIFYVAFGESTLAQLRISLRSLVEIAGYEGQVLVFTDYPQEKLCEEIPGLASARLLTATFPATDLTGFVAGKYCILEEQRAWSHAPVVYMDPDIVFNTDIRPLLVDIASATRLCAPLEDFSRLATAPSVGAELLQQDGEEPRMACGFNGGTIGIPNLKEHAATLGLIRRTIMNYLSLHGREALHWVDQEAANYVGYKLGTFETVRLTRRVRYGFATDAKELGPLTGLVHFWGIRPKNERPPLMQHYLDLLLAQRKATKSGHAAKQSP